MKIKEMNPIPAGENPFQHDFYNMGTRVGNNVVVMYDQHTDRHADYIIVVDMTTGERIRIELAAEKPSDNFAKMMVEKISKMSDDELNFVWKNLRRYDPSEEYAPGVSMDDWAENIYSEMGNRGLPTS